jgi:hypothetical protein
VRQRHPLLRSFSPVHRSRRLGKHSGHGRRVLRYAISAIGGRPGGRLARYAISSWHRRRTPPALRRRQRPRPRSPDHHDGTIPGPGPSGPSAGRALRGPRPLIEYPHPRFAANSARDPAPPTTMMAPSRGPGPGPAARARAPPSRRLPESPPSRRLPVRSAGANTQLRVCILSACGRFQERRRAAALPVPRRADPRRDAAAAAGRGRPTEAAHCGSASQEAMPAQHGPAPRVAGGPPAQVVRAAMPGRPNSSS